jgi:acetyltransferase-like isoleucine patch superfamily enzyme
MSSINSQEYDSQPVTMHAVAESAAEAQPPSVRSRLYDRVLPLRLFCIRVLNYLTNYIVAYVPSHAVRRLWYRRVLGIRLGENASVFMGTYVWFHGPREIRRFAVRIGRNSRINRDCTLDLRSGLTIGDNVSISPQVMILAGTHDVNDPTFPTVAGPIAIEDHAFIGTRATILAGVTLGRGAVVVANSLVSKDVPAMTIVGGSPARPIGMRDAGATVYELGSAPLFE